LLYCLQFGEPVDFRRPADRLFGFECP